MAAERAGVLPAQVDPDTAPATVGRAELVMQRDPQRREGAVQLAEVLPDGIPPPHRAGQRRVQRRARRVELIESRPVTLAERRQETLTCRPGTVHCAPPSPTCSANLPTDDRNALIENA
jgi:hypothetical protein